MANSPTRGNVIKYYVAHIVSGASFIVPITILYYLSFGLSYLAIASLESIFLFTALVLEIPTGVIADSVGRKYASSFGVLLVALATLTIGIGSTFFIFALGQIIFGVGAALRSGADTALMYDSLQDAGLAHHYIKIEGRSFALFSLFGALAAPFGAYLFTTNHRLPFFIDSGLLLVAAMAYGLMSESTAQRAAPNNKEHKGSFFASVKRGLVNPAIRWYLGLTVVLSVTSGFFSSVLSQPTMLSKGINVSAIGYIFGVMLLLQAAGAVYAEHIATQLRKSLSLVVMYMLPALAFIVMGVSQAGIFLVALLAYTTNKGFQYPLLKGYMQEHLETATRATMLSIQNFFDSLAGIILLPILGFIVDRISPVNGVATVGVVMLGVGFILFVVRPLALRRVGGLRASGGGL